MIVRGGQQLRVTLPLLAILEKPQHTPQQSPLVVSVERLSWDSLKVDLEEPAHDGIVAPGTDLPVSVAYNIFGRSRRTLPYAPWPRCGRFAGETSWGGTSLETARSLRRIGASRRCGHGR